MGEKVKGVAPGFLLLPAREYEWELVRRVEIALPLHGSLSELMGVPVSEKDDFFLFERGDQNTSDFVSLWETVRVLFALSKYPDLQDNECLNVVAVEVQGKELWLHAEIIRSL